MMSIIKFPCELLLQFLGKMNIVRRYHLSLTHSSLTKICFDWSLDRNSRGSITLNELHHCYNQANSDQERELCFEPKILDRLHMSNCNELIHLLMNHKNETFCTNFKLLQALKGKLVLEGENQDLCLDFCKKFLLLLEKIEGDMLIAFVNVKSLANLDGDILRNILSSKRQRGDKIYHIQHRSDVPFKIMCVMEDASTWHYVCYAYGDDGGDAHDVHTRNVSTAAEETNVVIGMLDGQNLLGCKQHLGKLLPVLDAYNRPVAGGYEESCHDCGALISLPQDNSIDVDVREPRWSNCDYCAICDITDIRYDRMKLATD